MCEAHESVLVEAFVAPCLLRLEYFVVMPLKVFSPGQLIRDIWLEIACSSTVRVSTSVRPGTS